MVELKNAGCFDYIRFIGSALLLIFSAVVTSYAIVETKTGFWKSVPGYAAIILFVVDLFILGIVEGLQIALVELKREHPDSYKHSHPSAYKLGQVASNGDNVERFLMGRQVFVVFLVFFAAKLTTIKLEPGESFLFPAPLWFQQIFLETGVLACVVVVIIAQLMPQIVAAKYPVHFLEFFIMKPAYYTCTFVEATGLTHICWVLSGIMSYAFGMGKTEEFDKDKDIDPKDAIQKIDQSLSKVMVDEAYDHDVKEKKLVQRTPTQMLDIAVTSIGQEEFARFTRMVETINNQVDTETLTCIKHYLDQHPEKFYKFPTVVGRKMYPSPRSLADAIEKDGQPVPKFLTPINDPEHIPPHVVACELLTENRHLKQMLERLRGEKGGHENKGFTGTKL